VIIPVKDGADLMLGELTLRGVLDYLEGGFCLRECDAFPDFGQHDDTCPAGIGELLLKILKDDPRMDQLVSELHRDLCQGGEMRATESPPASDPTRPRGMAAFGRAVPGSENAL